MKNSPPPAAAAPVIETTRLRLRGFVITDLPGSVALWNAPAVYQYISGKPSSQEDCWRGIMMLAGMWNMLGYGYWAIEETRSGKFIGQCGFADFQREITPPITAPEIGWALLPEFQGMGLATEACNAILHWADTTLAAPLTACIINPANLASLKLAEKLGYSKTAEVTYKDKPTLLLHRQR